MNNTKPKSSDWNRVVVTQPMAKGGGFAMLVFMQCCAVKDADDEEILRECNSKNPCGTSNGWATVYHSDNEDWGKTAPVQCTDDPNRMHYMVSC